MFESFRRLGPYVRPFRGDVIFMFVLGLGLVLVSSLLPILFQTVMEVYAKGNLETLMKVRDGIAHVIPSVGAISLEGENRRLVEFLLPISFPALYLIYGLLRYLHYAILNYTAERITAGIRRDLVDKILRLNLTYHGSLERGTGGLISRVFNDTTLLQLGLNFYVDLLREPIQALFYLGLMLWMDWKLTLFALLFLPFFLLITKQVSRSLRKYGILGREAMEDLTAVLKESVDGVRVVQSFNLEQEMSRRFRVHLQSYLHTAKNIVLREQAVSPINEFVISFLVMGFAFYSIHEVVAHGADGAKYIGFLVTAGLLQAPIKKLQDAGVKIQQSIVVTNRVFEILDSKSEVIEAARPKAFPENWKTIKFENVSFRYGSELTLKNINLTVKRGEVLALVGESGSGKSTVVNLLERFYDPTEGRILIDDVPLNEIGLKDLRAHVGLVTQDVFLFRDSIERNIQAGDLRRAVSALSAGSSGQFDNTGDAIGGTRVSTRGAAGSAREPQPEVVAAAKLANAHGFISATAQGYQSSVGERGSFLSGGEKQRVSIARAIFKSAPILILDEATSALDSVSEMEVQKGLNHLMEGRTAFVIAHRLSTVFNADRILVMKKGEIVEQGTHAELVAKGGEYNSFFQLQVNATS